jgi:hypothetical protein
MQEAALKATALLMSVSPKLLRSEMPSSVDRELFPRRGCYMSEMEQLETFQGIACSHLA